MPSVAERKRRRLESAILRKARIDLLTELDQLKGNECEKCENLIGSIRVTCGCPVATRKREIGKELSLLINERTEIEIMNEEVKKVARKKKVPEIREEAVNAMRAKGMTFAEIAEEFGVSAPTIANRRQNWELERVRTGKKESTDPMKVKPNENVNAVKLDEIPADLSISSNYEAQINELKMILLEKDEFINKQWNTIDKLTIERDKLAKQNEFSINWQDEIRDERKLLAVLLEREAAKMRTLLEVV